MLCNKLFKALAIFAAPILVQVAPVAAETAEGDGVDATEMNIAELMDVTVYGASKFEQPLSEAPSSVTVVTAEEIKRLGYRTLGEILQNQRSFLISYDRNYTYAGVRGFGRTGDYSTRILLLIDGHRVNENMYDSGFYGYEFPLDVDLIERVEVIRGSSSSLYGNNAFFGTVNIVTRRGRDLGGFETAAEGGSLNSFGGRVSYGTPRRDGLELLLSATGRTSGGNKRLYYREFDQTANPGEPRAAEGGVSHRKDEEYHYSFFNKVSLGDLTLAGAFVNRRKEVPTAPYGFAAFGQEMYTVDRRGFLDLRYEHAYQPANVMARVFYDHYDYYGPMPYFDASTPPQLVVNRDSAANDWVGTELQLSKEVDRHRIIVGGEYTFNLRQEFRNYDVSPYFEYLDANERTHRWALYLQDEVALLRNLILNAGARYDHFSTFGDKLSPRATLIYSPLPETTLKLIYGEAFRAPNQYEIAYGVPLLQRGNRDLKPETVRTYEAVLEQMLGERYRLAVNGFYTETRNHIVQQTDPSDGLLIFNNVEGEQTSGVEAELEGKWESGVQMRGSYSYQDARDKKTDEWLINSPHHMAKGSLILPVLRERLFAGTSLRYLSGRRTRTASTGSVTLVDLTLYGRRLAPGLELSASIYNLFGRNWSEPGSSDHLQDLIAQDGRIYRLKLTHAF